MNLEESLKQFKKLPKAKREKIHRIILWVIIPVVIVLWVASFMSMMSRVGSPEQSPEPVLGQRVIQGTGFFFSRLGEGVKRVTGAVGEAIVSMDFGEKLGWWWKKITRQPVIHPVESVSPVVLPVAPSETLL